MEGLLFVEYPKCSTCRNARKFLSSHDVPFTARHIVEEPLTKQELKQLVDSSGLDIRKFFNTSGMKYRELGLKDKLPNADEDEMLELLASDGMLIKRPLASDGKRVMLGFKVDEYEAWTRR